MTIWYQKYKIGSHKRKHRFLKIFLSPRIVLSRPSLLKLEFLELISFSHRSSTFLYNYDYRLSMTEWKHKLKWQLLRDHKNLLRLIFFHNIYYSKTGVEKDKYTKASFYVSSSNDHALKLEKFFLRVMYYGLPFLQRLRAIGTPFLRTLSQ